MCFIITWALTSFLKTRPNEFRTMTGRKTIQVHSNRQFAITDHIKPQKTTHDFVNFCTSFTIYNDSQKHESTLLHTSVVHEKIDWF